MTWEPELEELRRREAMAREMGGADKVRRQHEGGRLTVRERVEALVDRASFHEVGAIAGRAEYDAAGELQAFTPSNCVMGRAMVDGRPVVLVGDDFTVRGGSADATIREKPIMAERMAAELRLPIIRLIEGSGGGGSVKTIETTGPRQPARRRRRHAALPPDHRQSRPGAGGGAGARLRRGAGRRAARGGALLGDDQGLGDVRGRPAGGGAAGRDAGQARPRRLGDPMPRRRGGRRGRDRAGSLRPGAALPVLPALLGASTCRHAARARRSRDGATRR